MASTLIRLVSVFIVIAVIALLGAGAEKADKDAKVSLTPVLGGKSLAQWIRDIEDRDPSVRENAVRSVPHFGLEARKALPELIAELRSPDSGMRANAANAVGRLGLDEKNLRAGVSGLIRLLNDSQAVVRLQAATALGHIGPAANDALTALANTSRDSGSWEVRKAAVFALGVVGHDRNGPETRTTNALSTALSDASAPVRLEAIKSLLVVGPPTQSSARRTVTQGLQRLFTDRNDTVVIWARVAAMRPDQTSEGHLLAIARYLRNADPALRAEAASALGTLGLEATSRVPDLLDAVNKEKEDGTVVLRSLFALTRMGEGGQKALAQLAKHENPDIKKAATEALESVTKGTPKVKK
jgi:HEAT repeat protein